MFNERFSDVGNAIWFRRTFGEQVIWVPERGAWYVNHGTHWERDADGEIERFAKAAIADIFRSLNAAPDGMPKGARDEMFRHALKSEQAPRLAAALALLKSEEGITVSQSHLDVDPFLLGVKNGVVDLRTGELRQPKPDEFITRQVGCAFNPAAKCSTWTAFLERITERSVPMMEFLQRAIGYSLTGDAREQCIFIAYGTGANGKSVLISAARALAKDYAADATPDTFLDRRDGTVTNDLARLAGARFVPASEIDEGRRLAEALVKACTGGEAMSARFLFREYFSFTPQFKLWLSVNHKPQIRGDDHGIWRRIRLIPFNVTIPDSEQDRDLSAKLRREMPGLLNWALAGTRDWLKQGLNPPPEVVAATEAYRAESDALGEWLDERCVLAKQISVQARPLWKDYEAYTLDRGGKPMGMRHWAQRMAERGFTKHEGRVVQYEGIGLRDLCDLCDSIPNPSPYRPS